MVFVCRQRLHPSLGFSCKDSVNRTHKERAIIMRQKVQVNSEKRVVSLGENSVQLSNPLFNLLKKNGGFESLRILIDGDKWVLKRMRRCPEILICRTNGRYGDEVVRIFLKKPDWTPSNKKRPIYGDLWLWDDYQERFGLYSLWLKWHGEKLTLKGYNGSIPKWLPKNSIAIEGVCTIVE